MFNNVTGYAFSVPLGRLFLGTDCTIVEFLFIVAVLEQALNCVFYMTKATSVHMCISFGYINIMLAKLHPHTLQD